MVDGNWTNYRFDELWDEAVREERVKVVRHSGHYNLFDESGEGINKQPFEPMDLFICGPDDWPRTHESVALSWCGPAIDAAKTNKIAALLTAYLAVFLYSQ